jgi:hypothetical protein
VTLESPLKAFKPTKSWNFRVDIYQRVPLRRSWLRTILPMNLSSLSLSGELCPRIHHWPNRHPPRLQPVCRRDTSPSCPAEAPPAIPSSPSPFFFGTPHPLILSFFLADEVGGRLSHLSLFSGLVRERCRREHGARRDGKDKAWWDPLAWILEQWSDGEGGDQALI